MKGTLMIRRILIAVLAIAFAVPLFAGLSAKHKEWPSTPQGYFMTAAERAQWAALTTDDEAEKFIQQFLAVRGGQFPAEVAKRAEMADKYLTIGKMPGSKTLRGKTIILLGPPASMDVRDAVEGEGENNARAFGQAVARTGGETTVVTDAPRSAAGAGGMQINDSMQSTARNVEAVKARRYYTFTFQNDLVKKLDKTSLVVGIVADSSGKDEFASRSVRADADKAFELAAETSRVKK